MPRFSIDGDVAEIHDLIRGAEGALNQAVYGIKLLQEEGNDVSVCTTVNKLNFNRISNIKKLIQNLSIKSYLFQGLMPIGSGKTNIEELRLSPRRMKEIVQKLKLTFQRLYLHNASKEGFQKGELRTLAGRMCKTRDPNKKEDDYKIKNKGKNLPVQGLCADILKIAMGNLFLILEPREIKLINSVHDELVFECKTEEADEVAAIVKTEMGKAGNFFLKDIPCIAEVTIANFWKKE
jgi:MoaA/NifB/PqqE/SkfB family radical SAM enzyme